ncbi:MAG: hypothetical protein QXF28_04885 [Nitrososphaerota archaeon]
MPETMLGQRFHDIWYVGEVSEEGVDRIIECLLDYHSKAEMRIRLRFYLENVDDLSYMVHVRRILLQNTSLSILVEARPIEDLKRDVEAAEEEITLIKNKVDLQIPLNTKVKIMEV